MAAACVGVVSAGGAGIGSVVNSFGTLQAGCLLQREHCCVGAVMVVKVGCKVGSKMFATGVG